MLYNKDYLFIHIPRSAGKCIKSAIIPLLEKPIYFAQKVISKKYFNENDYIRINQFLIHSSLEELKLLKTIKNPEEIKSKRLSKMFIENQHLPDLEQTKNIIMCLRNPLDRAKSLYKFEVVLRGHKGDFKSFTDLLAQKKKPKFFSDIKNYCTIDNELPENIKFIRFEFLEDDLKKIFPIYDLNIQKQNEIFLKNEYQKGISLEADDIEKVISNINTWEEWAIQKGLLNAVTEKDFII
jgi:hypothetical protein